MSRSTQSAEAEPERGGGGGGRTRGAVDGGSPLEGDGAALVWHFLRPDWPWCGGLWIPNKTRGYLRRCLAALRCSLRIDASSDNFSPPNSHRTVLLRIIVEAS
jgi:hypothetical protein